MRANPLITSCIVPLDSYRSPANFLVPIVIEKSPQGERAYDIYSRLLTDRIVLLDSPIVPETASRITAQLLFLESVDATADIMLYINSPGGYVHSGMNILDTMRRIQPHVVTVCRGMCASMAAVLLTAGQKGKRYVMPNAEVMIHQPLGGAEGQSTDIQIAARHIQRTRETLNRILAECSGQPIDKVNADTERDNYLSAEEAVAYGLVDEIMPAVVK